MTILTPIQIAQVMYDADFRGDALAYITAIALAESSGDTDAISPEASDGTRGYGLVQVETENIDGGDWQDPTWQAAKAWTMSAGGTNFEPWCTAVAPMPIRAEIDGVVETFAKGCEGYGSGAAADTLETGYAAAKDVIPAAPAGWPGVYLRVQDPMIHYCGTMRWQTRMNELLKAELTVDGWYGAGTAAVTERFEKSKGLTEDGVVGPICWHAAFS